MDASSLKVEDEVEFVVEEDFKADKRYAVGLKLLIRGDQKRELGQARLQKNCWPILGFMSSHGFFCQLWLVGISLLLTRL